MCSPVFARSREVDEPRSSASTLLVWIATLQVRVPFGHAALGRALVVAGM
jgi:hypothetical protein